MSQSTVHSAPRWGVVCAPALLLLGACTMVLDSRTIEFGESDAGSREGGLSESVDGASPADADADVGDRAEPPDGSALVSPTDAGVEASPREKRPRTAAPGDEVPDHEPGDEPGDDLDVDDVSGGIEACPGSDHGAPDLDEDDCEDALDEDVDGDGVADEDEARLGTDPRDATDRPKLLRVRAGAPEDAADGLSWESAFPTLRAGLEAMADLTPDAAAPGELWVAMGTYHPDEGPGVTPDDPAATFVLLSHVSVLGGFAGTELSREARDWKQHVSVLSGDLGQDDTGDPSGDEPRLAIEGTNAHHVVSAALVDASARLDGFSIVGGDAPSQGGGIDATTGGPTLENLLILGNRAGSGGGGLQVGRDVVLSVSHTRFVENRTLNDKTSGAGLRCSGCRVELDAVVFEHNETFIGADNGGGGVFVRDGTVTMRDVVFRNNSASWGGALMISRGEGYVSGAELVGNRAWTGAGGAVSAVDSTLTIDHAVIAGNESEYGGGGMYLEARDGAAGRYLVHNTVIGGNRARGQGGGIGCNVAGPMPVRLTNVTIAGNHAGYYGGGVHCTSPEMEIHNALIWSNAANEGEPRHDSLRLLENMGPSHSLVEHVTTAQDGNLDALENRPSFLIRPLAAEAPNPEVTDLRVWPRSPTVDAGDPDAPVDYDVQSVASQVPTDVLGVDRVVGPAIDIGAYEVLP